ncbi:hypothetical protein DRP04_04145 [Archaeoglobales archaeon]|nr:MAG: hypothetical protein DRP04_04145 [Archaeoglobales archaeon]
MSKHVNFHGKIFGVKAKEWRLAAWLRKSVGGPEAADTIGPLGGIGARRKGGKKGEKGNEVSNRRF